jgi:hypothetical protein
VTLLQLCFSEENEVDGGNKNINAITVLEIQSFIEHLNFLFKVGLFVFKAFVIADNSLDRVRTNIHYHRAKEIV